MKTESALGVGLLAYLLYQAFKPKGASAANILQSIQFKPEEKMTPVELAAKRAVEQLTPDATPAERLEAVEQAIMAIVPLHPSVAQFAALQTGDDLALAQVGIVTPAVNELINQYYQNAREKSGGIEGYIQQIMQADLARDVLAGKISQGMADIILNAYTGMI